MRGRRRSTTPSRPWAAGDAGAGRRHRPDPAAARGPPAGRPRRRPQAHPGADGASRPCRTAASSIGAAASATAVARHAGRRARLSGRRPVGAADRQRADPEPRQPRRQHLQCRAVGRCGAGADLPSRRGRAIAGPAGRREVPLEALFDGPGRTASEPGELLVSILLPPPQPRSAAKYLRFTPRREMDIAIAGAGAWIRLDADGTIAEARIVLASVGADADPRAVGRAAADRRDARRARCSRRPAGSPPAMRGPSPTRAARPTIAARWSPC